MSDVQDKVNRLEAEVAELRSMDKVKRLEAEVAELRLMVLERDKIILELKGDKLSGKERRNCDAGTTWAVVCADVYLSHWCEMRLMPYVELVRMSMLCRTMQKRVVDSLRLLRRLDFRRDLLWPIPDTHRLAVVVRAIERMGGSLELLDLSALGKLSESESVQLVTALSQLKAGALKELIMPCLTPFKTVTKLLETLTSLERLDLSKNTLGDEGAVELASVLGELCALRRLDLGGKNNIGGDGCKALAGALVGLQHLEELLLPNNQMGESGDAFTRGLTDMTALQVLDLTGNQFVHEGVVNIGKSAPEALGMALGGLHSLHTLRLGNTTLVGDSLRGFTRGYLKTTSKHMRTQPGAEADGGAWPSLAGAVHMRAQPTCGHLLRLSIQRNGFHTDGCIWLAQVLLRMPMLEELDVSDNDISPEGIGPLAQALAGMPLRELNISENDLGAEGARLLAGMLSSLPNLTMLDLSDNNICDGALELAAGLPDTLCHLALACNKIRNKGVIALASQLPRLPALKQLLLEENDISDEGFLVLAESVKLAQSMTCLNLIRNKMADAGCAALTAAVSALPAMQKLLLGENFIGEVGCMSLASALGALSRLTELDLGGNRIGKDACGVLSAIARKNKTLSMRLEDQDEDSDRSIDEEGDFEEDEAEVFGNYWPGMLLGPGAPVGVLAAVEDEEEEDEEEDGEDGDDDSDDSDYSEEGFM